MPELATPTIDTPVDKYHPTYVKAFYVKSYFKQRNLRTSMDFVEAFDKHVESLLAQVASVPLVKRKTLTPADITQALATGNLPAYQPTSLPA